LEIERLQLDMKAVRSLAHVIRQHRAQSTHSPLKEAALPAPWHLNVGNLHNTGRSTESAPPAAMAEERKSAITDSLAQRF
jgi:hypothetical protein